MRVLGNLGTAVCTVVAGEHSYEHAQRSGPGHVWVRDAHGALRCDRCGMLRAWPGATQSCSGGNRTFLRAERKHKIAEALEDGVSPGDVARRFGITRRAVYRAVAEYETEGERDAARRKRDDEILRRREEGADVATIAAAMGLTKPTVAYVVKTIGRRRRAETLLSQGASLHHVAQTTGLSRSHVCRVAAELRARGEPLVAKSPFRQKLTRAKADAIRDALANGASPKELAGEYGVTVATVRDIRAGKTWR